MPDIFSYYRPYDSRNYRSVERRPRSGSAGAPGREETSSSGRAVYGGRSYDLRGIYPSGTFVSAPAQNVERLTYIDPLQENQEIIGVVETPTDWDALERRLGVSGVDYMTADGLRTSRGATVAVPQGNATGAASSSSSKAASAPKKGETVASYWTRVTGLPWKAAREMGLSDGSYASNIEIYKGLKNGSITKESLAAMSEAQNAVPYEPAPETYAMPARPVIERQRLPFDEPADMTPPSEREMQMAAYGGYLPLIGFAPAAYACGGKMKRR